MTDLTEKEREALTWVEGGAAEGPWSLPERETLEALKAKGLVVLQEGLTPPWIVAPPE
jgi:hypothetical protein